MATNDIYLNPGTPVTFKSTGGTILFTPTSLAFGAGRKSAEWDRGTGPQPGEYRWRVKTKFQGTPVVRSLVNIYLATGDGTTYDGEVAAGDAAFTDSNALDTTIRRIGSIVIDTTTTDAIHTSGTFRMVARYGILIWWNATAAATLSATAGDHEFIATPIPPQKQ
jgi:hypothetical protein